MMPSGGTALVRLEDVSKQYRIGENVVRALDHVNLELDRGELVVLLGPSGCGKSTLLNMVGGLDVPTSGRVWVDGADVGRYSEKALCDYRRGHIGFVFQFFNLVPTLTAYENVHLAAELVRKPLNTQTVLQDVGLGERGSHFPNELSGGEQQRVAIARAIVKNPPILLCDEPTGELDFETGRSILTLIHRLNHEQNQTVLIVSHNVAIAQMADRVIRMQSGHIVEDRVNEVHVDPAELEW